MSSSPYNSNNDNSDEYEVEEEDDEELTNGDTDDEVSIGNASDDFANRFVRSWESEDGTRLNIHTIHNGRVLIRNFILPSHPWYDRSHRDRVNIDYLQSIRAMRMEQIINEESHEEYSNEEEEEEEFLILQKNLI